MSVIVVMFVAFVVASSVALWAAWKLKRDEYASCAPTESETP